MSEVNVQEIVIGGTTYVPKGAAQAPEVGGMKYVLVRTYSAGVHCGYLKARDGKEVTLARARRLWYWSGAASLSQLAMEGVSKPGECKFSVPVDEILLTEAIEVIPMADAAYKSVSAVEEWRA